MMALSTRMSTIGRCAAPSKVMLPPTMRTSRVGLSRQTRAASCRYPISLTCKESARPSIILGDTELAQQHADIDRAGGQVDLPEGQLAAQIELDQRRERRAGQLALDR